MRAKEISDLVNQFASETLADIESMEARIQDSINSVGALFVGQVSALQSEIDLLNSAKKVTEDMVAHQTEQFHIEHKKALDLEAETKRLRDALAGVLPILDALVQDSGRELEWDAEDAFRRGEWFEPEDLAAIENARAVLSEAS